MFKNYLTITLRSILKHKTFSAINILGLSLSMSICLILITFIKDQRSFDRFHEHSDRIYRVIADAAERPGELNPAMQAVATSPSPLAPHLVQSYPGVADVARLRWFSESMVDGEEESDVGGFYAEPSFFSIFSFGLLSGDPLTALAQPNAIVLTQETAETLFGQEDPMGRLIPAADGTVYVVTGVLENVPYHSHLQFDALVSFSTLTMTSDLGSSLEDWTDFSQYYTYILLAEHHAASDLATHFPEIVEQYYPDAHPNDYIFKLQALTDIQMGPLLDYESADASIPGFIVWLVSLLALIIMLNACMNYVSLSIANSLKRAKEVGMRKVAGAYRSQIIRQFLCESILLALVAGVLACLLLFWLVPLFHQLQVIQAAGFQLTFDLASGLTLVLLFIAFSLFVGLLAGLYPAFYLSAFQPARVLKGLASMKGMAGGRLRKTLIVTQFAFSLLFMITCLLIYKQARLMADTDYGFRQTDIINVYLQEVPYEPFRNALLNYPNILDVSATSVIPVSGGSTGRRWINSDVVEQPARGDYRAIDPHFLDNLGLSLVAGRNFAEESTADLKHSVILNETAVRALGLGSPPDAIGQRVFWDETQEGQVIGVVQDYQYGLPVEPIFPLVLRYDPERFYTANIRIRPQDVSITLEYLDEVWKTFDPIHPAEYQFFAQQLRENPFHRFFQDILHIVGLVAGFALFNACLGLLGMAIYSVRTRIKEVGIRKVLGASVFNITLLLSKDFTKLMLIVVGIAVPISWWINALWLQQFVQRVEVGIGDLSLGIVALLVLAFTTVGSQTVRAALSNPTETLRSE